MGNINSSLHLNNPSLEKKPEPVKKNNDLDQFPSLSEIEMPDFKEDFFRGFSDHTIGISACIYAASRGAEYLEKHYSNNKSMNVDTQQAHVCSMNYEDLNKLREYCDSITLLKSK